MTSILKFKYPSTTYIIGKRYSGKSEAAKTILLHNYTKFDVIMIISTTLFKKFWDFTKHLKSKKTKFKYQDHMNIELMLSIAQKQKSDFEEKGSFDKRILLLFDDYTELEINWMNKDIMGMIKNCRHFNISLMFLSQTVVGGKKYIRNNSEYIMLKRVTRSDIESYVDNVCPVTVPKRQFRIKAGKYIAEDIKNIVVYIPKSNQYLKVQNDIVKQLLIVEDQFEFIDG